MASAQSQYIPLDPEQDHPLQEESSERDSDDDDDEDHQQIQFAPKRKTLRQRIAEEISESLYPLLAQKKKCAVQMHCLY